MLDNTEISLEAEFATIIPLINERAKTHGDYMDTARIAQSLKRVIASEVYARQERQQRPLTSTQRESLDMIMSKVARILAGEPNEPDHWQDIAGYAKIAL